MNTLYLCKKFSGWISIYSISKFIYLLLALLFFLTYSNLTFAEEAKNSTQSAKTSNKETITGAFGIKFGEPIQPFSIGNDPHLSTVLPNSDGTQTTISYKRLKPPINLKDIVPNAKSLNLLGISDDNDRVVKLEFTANANYKLCENDCPGTIMALSLREKYKIIQPIKLKNNYGGWYEVYGDNEGNRIFLECELGSLTLTYESHLLSEYFKRLKDGLQKEREQQKEKTKESLNKGYL